MPLGLLGKKLGQTRIYDAKGIITSVTIVLSRSQSRAAV